MSSKGSSYFAATFENLLSARKARPSPTRDQGAHPFVATSGKIEGLNGHTDQLMELAGTTDPMVFSRVLSEAAGHSRVQPGDHGAGLLIKLRSGIAKVSRFGQADGRANAKQSILLR